MLSSHKIKTYQSYAILFIVFQAVFISLLFYLKDQKENQYFEKVCNKQSAEFHSTLDIYSNLARITLEEIIITPSVVNIMAEATNANDNERKRLRQSLYEKLLPTYGRISKKYLRQVHFHFADGKSFLRMHKPEKFDDYLFDVRPTIKKVNEEQRYVEAFELGRHYHAFRFLAPINLNGQHLGSVETGVPFFLLQRTLNQHFPGDYFFMLKKKVASSKLFQDSLDNYIPTDLSEDYLHEKVDMMPENIVDSHFYH